MEETLNEDENMLLKMRRNVDIHYIHTDESSTIHGVVKAYIDSTKTFLIFETKSKNYYDDIRRQAEYCKLSEIRNIFTYDWKRRTE